MRNLSVVAMLLGISAACSNQPAATVPPPAEADSQPAGSAPAHAPASTAPHTFSQSPWSPGAQTTTW
jgi:hypothetical protein